MAEVIDTEQINIIAKDECELNLDVTGEYALKLESVQGVYNTPLLDVDDYIKFKPGTKQADGTWKVGDEYTYPEGENKCAYLGRANLDVTSFYSLYLQKITVGQDDKQKELSCLIKPDDDLMPTNEDTPPTKYGFCYASEITDCSDRWKYLLGIRKLPVECGTQPERGPLFAGTPYFFIKCIGLTCTSRYVWQQDKEYPVDDKDAGKKRAKDIYAGVQNIVSVNNNQFTLNSVFQLTGGEFQNLNGNDLHNIKFKIVDIYDKPVPIYNEVLWTFTLAKVKPKIPPPGVLVKKYSQEEVAEYVDPDDPDQQSEQPGNGKPPTFKDDKQKFDSSLKQLKLINAAMQYRAVMKAKNKEIKQKKAEIEDLEKTLEEKEEELEKLKDTHVDLDLNININEDKPGEIPKLKLEGSQYNEIPLQEISRQIQTAQLVDDVPTQDFGWQNIPDYNQTNTQTEQIPKQNMETEPRYPHVYSDLEVLKYKKHKENEKEELRKQKEKEIEELRKQIEERSIELGEAEKAKRKYKNKYKHEAAILDNVLTGHKREQDSKDQEISELKTDIQKYEKQKTKLQNMLSLQNHIKKEEQMSDEIDKVRQQLESNPNFAELYNKQFENEDETLSASRIDQLKQIAGIKYTESLFRATNKDYQKVFRQNKQNLIEKTPMYIELLSKKMKDQTLLPGIYNIMKYDLSRIKSLFDMEPKEYLRRLNIPTKEVEKIINVYESWFQRHPEYKDVGKDFKVKDYNLLRKNKEPVKIDLNAKLTTMYTPQKPKIYSPIKKKEPEVEELLGSEAQPGDHHEEKSVSLDDTPIKKVDLVSHEPQIAEEKKSEVGQLLGTAAQPGVNTTSKIPKRENSTVKTPTKPMEQEQHEIEHVPLLTQNPPQPKPTQTPPTPQLQEIKQLNKD